MACDPHVPPKRYVDATESKALKAQFVSLCAQLKGHAKDLVDAAAPPDAYIASALGKAEGHYADHLWREVKHATERASYWKETRIPVTMKEDVVAKAKQLMSASSGGNGALTAKL